MVRAIILAALIVVVGTSAKADDKNPTREDCAAVVVSSGLVKKTDFEETKIGPPNELRPTLHAEIEGRYSFYCTGEPGGPVESAEILIFEASAQETKTLVKTFAGLSTLVHIQNSQPWTARSILTILAMTHGEATLQGGTSRLFISGGADLGHGSLHLRAEDLAARPW